MIDAPTLFARSFVMAAEPELMRILVNCLKNSCRLFRQHVSDNNRLPDPQEPRYDDQWLDMHIIEEDFLVAIHDTKSAIRQAATDDAEYLSVQRPLGWFAELLGEINELEIAALWPYVSQNGPAWLAPTVSLKDRMMTLRKVRRRLKHLGSCV